MASSTRHHRHLDRALDVGVNLDLARALMQLLSTTSDFALFAAHRHLCHELPHCHPQPRCHRATCCRAASTSTNSWHWRVESPTLALPKPSITANSTISLARELVGMAGANVTPTPLQSSPRGLVRDTYATRKHELWEDCARARLRADLSCH